MNELTSLDYDKIKAGLEQEWDNIEFVTGERGKGMSTLAIEIRNEQKTRMERIKEQLNRGLRWYWLHVKALYMVLYVFLAPMYLLVGLLMFARNNTMLVATVFITLSCMMFIVLGAAMARYANSEDT